MELRTSSNHHPGINDKDSTSSSRSHTAEPSTSSTHSCREPSETGMTCSRRSLRPRPSTHLCQGPQDCWPSINVDYGGSVLWCTPVINMIIGVISQEEEECTELFVPASRTNRWNPSLVPLTSNKESSHKSTESWCNTTLFLLGLGRKNTKLLTKATLTCCNVLIS